MLKSQVRKNKTVRNRVFRVRKSLKGDASKPRLSIYKSSKHLFAQLIDDESHKTLLGIGTQSTTLQKTKFNKKSKDSAKHLGALVAQFAKERKIERVVFDRGRYKFHGLVAEFANSAREAGLQF